MRQPVIDTERLLLRELTLNDAAEIFELRSDVGHNQYIDRPLAATIEDAKDFINKIAAYTLSGQSYFWVVTDKATSGFAGTVTLWNLDKENNKAEIGYELLPAHQGKGLMHEAVEAVLQFAFEQMQFTTIEAWTHPDNERSAHLLKSFDFVRNTAAEQQNPPDVTEHIYTLRR